MYTDKETQIKTILFFSLNGRFMVMTHWLFVDLVDTIVTDSNSDLSEAPLFKGRIRIRFPLEIGLIRMLLHLNNGCNISSYNLYLL